IIAAVAYSGVVFAKKRKRPTTSAIDPTDPTGSTEPRDPSTTSAGASSPIQLTGGDDAARK
ncbi:MAG: ABC transporter permease, partial [Brevibacterium aurantiacum]|nr:ABC transporter permease [Brevibacterium aurantiacum]